MCIRCHTRNPQRAIFLYNGDMNNPQCQNWNSSSLNHIFLDACGFNGFAAAQLALKFIQKYLDWYPEEFANNGYFRDGEQPIGEKQEWMMESDRMPTKPQILTVYQMITNAHKAYEDGNYYKLIFLPNLGTLDVELYKKVLMSLGENEADIDAALNDPNH